MLLADGRGVWSECARTWELRVFAGRDPVSGRDRYKTKTVKGGRRAAEDALAAFITQVGAGLATSGTFGELVERWFEVASVARDRSPKTVMETRRIIDKQMRPLWSLRLDRVRTSVLDSYYAALRARGERCGHRPVQDHGRDLCDNGAPLSASTVRRVHVVRDGCDELVVRPPADLTSAAGGRAETSGGEARRRPPPGPVVATRN